MSRTVMFLHGAWLTPASFDLFRARYEARGYTCVAPAWPYEDRPVAQLRRSPHPDLKTLTIRRIVAHYAHLIEELPEAPILIGHSFGGLFVQLLLDRGFGAAGVAIDPVPPRGVLARPTAVLSALPVLLSWNGWNRVLTMSRRSFASSFAQGLPPSDRPAAYERHVIPTPGRIFFQALLGIGIGVNYRNPDRAPLLLIAGSDDRTITPSMVRAAYRKHRRSPVKTAFQTFANRSHFLIAEPKWEEVADYAIEWARVHAAAAERDRPMVATVRAS